MAAEIYVFIEAFDALLIVAQDVRNALNINIPIDLVTDSKQVFEAITKGKRTMREQLMIDINCARQVHERF